MYSDGYTKGNARLRTIHQIRNLKEGLIVINSVSRGRSGLLVLVLLGVTGCVGTAMPAPTSLSSPPADSGVNSTSDISVHRASPGGQSTGSYLDFVQHDGIQYDAVRLGRAVTDSDLG